MPSVKIRFGSVIKKVRLSLQWSELQDYIEQAFTLSLTCYQLHCRKPKAMLLKSQEDLADLADCDLIELEIVPKEESVYSRIIKELLDMPSNRDFTVKRFVDIMRQYPSTSLDALIPSNLENQIKEKLADIYREACRRTERKNPFKLVYVNEGGKQVLKGMPSSQWINYSTTNFEDLSRSLPANVIQKLSK
jgi:hypothetical protein